MRDSCVWRWEVYAERKDYPMKRIGDKLYVTEEEVSPSYRYPVAFEIIGMPLCNVCQNWNGPGKCKKLGKSPDAYREVDKRDCPEAVLDTEIFCFKKFSELYPEDTKRLLEQ